MAQCVYVTRRVPHKAIDALKAAGLLVSQWDGDEAVPRAELLDKVARCDALFCLLTDAVDEELLDAAGGRLRAIGTMSVGYDHVDVAEVRRRNIPIGYTPDVLTEATAELTVALTLAVGRRLVEAAGQVRNGGWGTWGPMWMCGQGVHGSTLGMYGFGRIGQSVARKLAAFGPRRILYHCRERKGAAEVEIGALCEFVDFAALLARSDFVIICASLGERTKFAFDQKAFSMMKRNAIVVNTSRGPLIEQDALYEALASKRIAAAGLDVCYPEPIPTDHRLLQLDNCLLLPHIGSATVSTRERMAVLTADNIVAALAGRPMPAPIP